MRPTGGGGGGGGVCVSVCPGLVHLPGLRQARETFLRNIKGFVTGIRESEGWAGKGPASPKDRKHKFLHLLSEPQRAAGPRVHLYIMLGGSRGFVNIVERMKE